MVILRNCSRIIRNAYNNLGLCLGNLSFSASASYKNSRKPFIHRYGLNKDSCNIRTLCSSHTKSPSCLRSELLCDVVDPIQDGSSKVTVVGSGMVGVSCVNAILFQKISSHVALVDAFPKKLKGEGMDLNHGLSFLGDPVVEYGTDFCISSNSKVVVITTGVRKCKNDSESDVIQRNADIIKSIILPLIEYSPKAVFVIASNPVDILTWVAWKVSSLPINRIIGSGTHVDTARFRHFVANRVGVASSAVQGYIIGEHGKSLVPLWSCLNVGGVQFRELLPNIGLTTDEEKWHEIVKDVVDSDSTVKCLKGYANTAIGLAVADIVKNILRNTQTVKTVSTLIEGHYDIKQEVFLSLPCCIGENGVTRVVRVRMTEQEKKMLQASAMNVHKVQKKIKA